ncbi:glutathione S-transferase family protein [Granulosicoccus sp.]|nr:glutathione S-transferase family protein [Granulosicoccus sp.]
MTTLYEMFPTRSQRVKWMLEEIGLHYDTSTVDTRSGGHRSLEYTAVNPMQVVPTLQTADYKIHESVAIVLQLADEHQKAGLAPPIGTSDRARYYQWCVFGSAELDFPIGLITQNELLLPEDERSETLGQLGRELFSKRANILSAALGDEPYILGHEFSGADIVLGYNCFWSTFTGLLDDQPVLMAYLKRLQDRSAFQRAFAEPGN